MGLLQENPGRHAHTHEARDLRSGRRSQGSGYRPAVSRILSVKPALFPLRDFSSTVTDMRSGSEMRRPNFWQGWRGPHFLVQDLGGGVRGICRLSAAWKGRDLSESG